MHQRLSRCWTCLIVRFVRLGSAQSAPEQRREHRPVAQSLLRANVGRVQKRLRPEEREPVSHTDAVRPDALSPGDSRSQFGRQQAVVGRLDRQLADGCNPHVDRDRPELSRLESREILRLSLCLDIGQIQKNLAAANARAEFLNLIRG
jgi:hypothetical protein